VDSELEFCIFFEIASLKWTALISIKSYMAMKNSILLKRKLKFIRDMKVDDACLIGCSA
jgi:hypothetical protein